jgi:phosphoribosylglycinamide formyltransferase-1
VTPTSPGRAGPRRGIVVVISGRGTNMLALIEASRTSDSPFTVAGVLSDRPDAPGLEGARRLGVPAFAVPARPGGDRAAYDRSLGAAISKYSPGLVALAGFMRILSAEFVQAFEGRILNIHPSLLPDYPGLNTHRRALADRVREHGATVHFVTAELDGGPAVLQGSVPVSPDDTEPALAARVLALEHRIYPLAVRWFCEDRLHYAAGRAWLDGRPLDAPVRFPEDRA